MALQNLYQILKEDLRTSQLANKAIKSRSGPQPLSQSFSIKSYKPPGSPTAQAARTDRPSQAESLNKKSRHSNQEEIDESFGSAGGDQKNNQNNKNLFQQISNKLQTTSSSQPQLQDTYQTERDSVDEMQFYQWDDLNYRNFQDFRRYARAVTKISVKSLQAQKEDFLNQQNQYRSTSQIANKLFDSFDSVYNEQRIALRDTRQEIVAQTRASLNYMPVIQEGHLKKRQKVMKTYKPYWFVLTQDGQLFYYRNPTKLQQDFRRQINLDTLMEIDLVQNRSSFIGPIGDVTSSLAQGNQAQSRSAYSKEMQNDQLIRFKIQLIPGRPPKYYYLLANESSEASAWFKNLKQFIHLPQQIEE